MTGNHGFQPPDGGALLVSRGLGPHDGFLGCERADAVPAGGDGETAFQERGQRGETIGGRAGGQLGVVERRGERMGREDRRRLRRRGARAY